MSSGTTVPIGRKWKLGCGQKMSLEKDRRRKINWFWILNNDTDMGRRFSNAVTGPQYVWDRRSSGGSGSDDTKGEEEKGKLWWFGGLRDERDWSFYRMLSVDKLDPIYAAERGLIPLTK